MTSTDSAPARITDAEGSSNGDHDGAAGFRPFFNAATGEWVQFTAVPENGGEDIVRLNWRSVPGGAVTEHLHPRQEERFIITAGEGHFTLGDEECVVGAGQTLIVAAGVRHSQTNRGSVEIVGVVELRPGLQSREMFEAFAGLVADGGTSSRGAPTNPLRLGATFWHLRHESRATSPPIWLQNLALPALSALARVFGVRPYYERWDSRIGDAELSPAARRSD